MFPLFAFNPSDAQVWRKIWVPDHERLHALKAALKASLMCEPISSAPLVAWKILIIIIVAIKVTIDIIALNIISSFTR